MVNNNESEFRVVFDDTLIAYGEMPTEAHRAGTTNNDYPQEGATPESQIITLTINKKVAVIAPIGIRIFEIIYGDERYSLNLYPLLKITKELAICLAQHAIRLKKDIRFLAHKNEVIALEIELNKKEILIVKYDTEHFFSKTTRIRHLQFPNNKLKFEEIEHNVSRRMRLLAPPERKELIGYEFKDLKNNPIAYMSNFCGAILLLWNILLYREGPPETPITYLDYILTNYSAKCDEVKVKAMEKIEQEREKRRKIEYTQFVEKMFCDSINELQNRLNGVQSDIDTHMRGIYTKEKEMVRDTDFLLKLKNRSTSKEIKTQLETDYKLISRLKKTNKYTNFRFDAGSIVGKTSMIKFFNKYEIGVFDVYLSLNGTVKCFNKTYIADGEYGHPHISHGNPCWGNLGDAVFKMLRSNQFGAAFDMMYEFLMRYNDGRSREGGNRPYRRLEEWNPAFRQQGLTLCNNCNRIKELCHCEHEGGVVIAGRCNTCNQFLMSCQCSRCPAEQPPNNVIGFHIDCNSDCDHYDNDGECCGY